MNNKHNKQESHGIYRAAATDSSLFSTHKEASLGYRLGVCSNLCNFYDEKPIGFRAAKLQLS